MNAMDRTAFDNAGAEFDVDDLPLSVFELADGGMTVESLTAGHGLVENGASWPSCGSSCSSLP
ncbi:thiomuracin/GE37468 family thiazolyl RiPP peptide [Micromonospora sagamiensis]|uniref:GE37468 family thiazolyl peptide n=1 Tax=Micromonospora sagamiensis TaxID=47875 RepID=A0A562WES7_9ACTN|nr:thiomuracin/GE37468 family thiazolyl RiPP peptide [Micromonospora sagamiensis]TWJ28783.1 hypothetical protein JD81_02289 [Micromonospora sagamiensis]BCL12311.1 hypothetical protein GCM10017556_00500 [Micromonospora sagamiensis]